MMMKRIMTDKHKVQGSDIILGCLKMASLSTRESTVLIHTALEAGVNHFDHADIYGDGQSEATFGKVLNKNPELRDQIILQSKCGIGKGYYDSSRNHIINSVEESLNRLKSEYLDVLLLHRPDTLIEPEEVAEAFSYLYDSGKVRHFGVSNYNAMQMEMLSQSTEKPLVINQLQFSLMHTALIDAGLHVNTGQHEAVNRDGSVLEYCRLKGITIQAWSPLANRQNTGTLLNHDEYPELNRLLDRMAEARNVTPSAVALAWILRHPAGIRPVVGTTQPGRLKELAGSSDVMLNRQEWYALYHAAGNQLP